MKQYNQLRQQYTTFEYTGFDVEEENELVKITYHFNIPGLSKFDPKWRFMLNGRKVSELKENGTFMNMVFSLGMVELISYWKICCPPNVNVYGYALDANQIAWWKELYFLGLGEYFYTNNINEAAMADFMTINSYGSQNELPMYPLDNNAGCLVPIGGGKDSVVSIELLKKTNEKLKCYIINPRGATLNTVHVAGLDDDLLVAKRTLDKNMIELNATGYLNGHTPYSAIVAFSATITAYLYNLKYITLSNEASANESTVKDSDVNHQYSKSFKFEKDFHDYEASYIKSNTMYFSLLRPLSEFQIAKYFATCKDYHGIFRSCNVGSKEDIWCGHCPKCLFVYVILSPFLSREHINEIFGRNMAEDMDMKETLDKLTGIAPEKPFECVGSRDEVNMALCITISNMLKDNLKLPKLFEYYKNTYMYEEYSKKECTFFKEFEQENLLPDTFKKLVFEGAVEH